jgi:hypothetical protein
MEHTEKIALLKDYLATEGYCPAVDADGDIMVKVAGKLVAIRCHEDDPNFYKVARPFCMFDEVSLGHRGVACDVSSSIKVGKLVQFHQYFAAVAEGYYENLGDFLSQITRLINMTEVLVGNYLQTIEQIEKAAREQANEASDELSLGPSQVSNN